MDADDFLRQLDADGGRLAACARAGDLDATVPGLDWRVRDVVAHTTGVHGWCEDLVRERRTDATGGSDAFAPDPTAADVVDRFVAGHAALVATLTAAPDGLRVWGFGHQVPARSFWSRRQAHETAVHRADVEGGAGVPVTPVDPAFAQDGLDEITFFASLRRSTPVATGRLALRAEDGDDRLIVFGDRIVTTTAPDVGAADASVSGTTSDLYLWAWNRPSPAVVEGDPALVTAWREVRI